MATDPSGSAEAASGGASGGLPQLDFETWPSQIFWLAVALVVLYQLMSKIALPRIGSVLEERADAIADDLDRAEEFRRKAHEAEQAYERALAEARAKAQSIAAETRAKIQSEVEAENQRADAEISARTAEAEKRIEEIRANAMANVEQIATDAGHAVVARFLPDIDESTVKSAVSAKLG